MNIQELQEKAREAEKRYIELETELINQTAINFYQRIKPVIASGKAHYEVCYRDTYYPLKDLTGVKEYSDLNIYSVKNCHPMVEVEIKMASGKIKQIEVPIYYIRQRKSM